MPNSLRVVLALSISAILSLALGELFLSPFRLFEPFPRFYVEERETEPSRNFIPDEKIGWRMRPSHRFEWDTPEFRSSYQSNAQGFRAGVDFEPKREKSIIVLVGDSFTFGFGVDYEQTFGAIIGEKLDNTLVYNLAMPGFGVDQMWLSTKHQAVPFRPDLVIVGICDADLKRSESAYRPEEGFNKPAFGLVNGKLVRKTKDDRPNRLIHVLEHHSRLWMAGRLLLRFAGYYYPIGNWWHLNEAILNEIQTVGRNHNFDILFVYIPTKEWRPFPMLGAYMSRSRANYVSLREGGPSKPRQLYWQQDDHLNPLGHQYSAARILGWINQNISRVSPELVREGAGGTLQLLGETRR